ncbi:DUF4412 domain-containing protein [Desulfobotulus sp.]|jgi:hypothetical protein|uniref:DUF4412 domain-containing protein n=1 Tax=Desulfobotulus sp. TaxID=1940337 RepID=UPI002A36C452|nr:DUF4412 domain-containing protein [Desulfobotulus sp.]MDY0163878.1 DUF4412 domain-containing protein [Desulfobotulus sp.]
MKKLAMVLMFWGLASLASADLMMQMLLEDYEEEGRETTTLYMTKDRIRTEAQEGGQGFVSIGRMDRDVIWMVRMDRKIYAEISMTEMRRMHEEALAHEAAGKAMMEEQLAGMDPEEREGYLAYLGMDHEEDTPLQYVKKGQDRVGKWTCTLYEGMRNQQKVEEICTVPLKTLGIEEKDFHVLQKMAMEEDKRVGGKEWKEMETRGFPVRTVLFDGERAISSEKLLNIERKNLPASLFDLPADFRKVPMMALYGE